MKRASILTAVALVGVAIGMPAVPDARPGKRCGPVSLGGLDPPGWLTQRRATVLVDSVLLSGIGALRGRRPCWRLAVRGRPALMVRLADQDLRARGHRVGRLVIVGLGYNSLWERGRRRYAHWAGRFDREARGLLRTLRRLGARQVVWVTLREPTPRTVPPHARAELGQYSWYFPYVNERLRRLDRRLDDLVLANWAAASKRPGLTYDSIHLNRQGGRLMARTIWAAVSREARRQARGP